MVKRANVTCEVCGHVQDEGRFCGRCGAHSSAPAQVDSEEVAGLGPAEAAGPFVVGLERRHSRIHARRWWPLAVVVGGLGVLGVVAQLAGDEAGEGPPPSSPASAGPDGGGQTQDEPAVEPAATAELPEDTYCSWERADATKCDVWAVRSGLGPFTHVVAAGERVIASVEDAVVALDASDGAVVWTRRGDVPALVTATPDRVIVTDGGGRTVALDGDTGAEVWEASARAGRLLWQAARDGVVVNREPLSMTVFASEDGVVIWEQNVPAAGGDGTPIIAGEFVVSLAGGALVGYSLATGDEVWQAPVVPTVPPLHWPGTDVVVAAEDGRLTAVDVATGAQTWTLSTEGVEEVADVDANTIAVVMPSRVDLVDRETGSVMTPLHAASLRAIHASEDGAFFAKVGASSVDRWQVDPLGPTWSLNAGFASSGDYTAVESSVGDTYVVAPIGDGTTLVAFRVSARDRGDPRWALACEGSQPSWLLGTFSAWAGETVHAAVTDEPERELWIGIPGESPSATLTVSGRPLDGTGEARFSHFDEEWHNELTIGDGGRSAAGFPPHWVVAAEFSQPGCWEIHVVGDEFDDTVVLPVPAADVE